MPKINLKVIAVAICSISIFTQAAFSSAYFDQGVRLYNQHKFKEALPYFTYAVKESDASATTYYWTALAYSQLGMWGMAKENFKQAYLKSTDDQIAQAASVYLVRLDPSFLKQNPHVNGKAVSSSSTRTETTQSSSSNSSSSYNGPDHSKVYFTMDEDRKMLVDAYINNHFTKMVFDTGAEGCHFSKNALQSIGILPPTGDPNGKNRGVGGTVDTRQTELSIRIGNPPIEKKVRADVQEADYNMRPLLGQNFFNGFEYDIDNGAHCINFRKKGSANTANKSDLYSIPFTNVGKEMVVNVECKNRKCSLFFDTGAHSTMMSKANLAQLGVEVPLDAPVTNVSGIGGTETARQVMIEELRVGPIVKRDFVVTVGENSMGLLGQDFFQDWRYTVDNSNHVIKLFH